MSYILDRDAISTNFKWNLTKIFVLILSRVVFTEFEIFKPVVWLITPNIVPRVLYIEHCVVHSELKYVIGLRDLRIVIKIHLKSERPNKWCEHTYDMSLDALDPNVAVDGSFKNNSKTQKKFKFYLFTQRAVSTNFNRVQHPIHQFGEFLVLFIAYHITIQMEYKWLLIAWTPIDFWNPNLWNIFFANWRAK